MRTKVVVAAVSITALVAVWILVTDPPALVIRTLVSLRTRLTTIEANREVDWAQGPALATAPPGARAPNIVVILADDLGWNDLTFGGGGVAGGAVPTPNIDRIARDGVTFTAGYAGDATCAPSRAAIMTGRYATRFGFEFTPIPLTLNKVLRREAFDGVAPIYHAELEEALPDVADMGLPASEVTIAELLAARGYHTLMLGKWHLGERADMRPDARGFDEALAFLPGASLYLPEDSQDVVNARIPSDPADSILWAALPYAVTWNGSARFAPNAYMTDYLANEAARAIEANKHRPFFMYLAFNAPHTPLQALKSDFDALANVEDHRLRVYAAMIRALDRAVGRVLLALQSNGLEANTLVIFTSDNGGAGWVGLPDLNKPYRGWKMTFFEGGIHVPFFMKWPAVLPKSARFDAPVAHVDVFATAASAAGAPIPEHLALDGVDLVPYVTGSKDAAPHATLFWRSGHYRSLIEGRFKLQTSDRPRRSWLFDLAADPTEQDDLAAADPNRLNDLLETLRGIDALQAEPLWPSILEGPVAIDHPAGRSIGPDDELVYWPN